MDLVLETKSLNIKIAASCLIQLGLFMSLTVALNKLFSKKYFLNVSECCGTSWILGSIISQASLLLLFGQSLVENDNQLMEP